MNFAGDRWKYGDKRDETATLETFNQSGIVPKKLLEYLSEKGRFISLFCPEKADKAVIFAGQYHGCTKDTWAFKKSKKLTEMFVQHHERLLAASHMADECLGDRLLYMMEGMRGRYGYWSTGALIALEDSKRACGNSISSDEASIQNYRDSLKIREDNYSNVHANLVFANTCIQRNETEKLFGINPPPQLRGEYRYPNFAFASQIQSKMATSTVENMVAFGPIGVAHIRRMDKELFNYGRHFRMKDVLDAHLQSDNTATITWQPFGLERFLRKQYEVEHNGHRPWRSTYRDLKRMWRRFRKQK